MNSPDAVVIEFGPRAGTGAPPQWSFVVTHMGTVVTQMSGPRILVLTTLARWVEAFEESSRPV